MEQEMNLKEKMESKIMVSPIINSVPLTFWKEFKRDAELNYSNSYIMKIMANHYQSFNVNLLEKFEERISAIEDVIFSTTEKDSQQEESKESPKIKTFGGKKD